MKHALLNNVTHKDLKVITRPAAKYGDSVGAVIIFPTEYADILCEYPILIRKDPATSEFQSVALLGFAEDENLFLDATGWNASYIPGVLAKGPFLIGFEEREIDNEICSEPVIHIDMNHPRVSVGSAEKGEPVFLTFGGNTPYINRIAKILKTIHSGMLMSKSMFDAFCSYDLIEPVTIEVNPNEERQYSLNGYHTISEEKLAALSGDSLEQLNKAGFLPLAFFVIASLNNMKKLIAMKNRRIANVQRDQELAKEKV
ncbi:MAG: SapC family protein [Pseudomonadota bacterium]